MFVPTSELFEAYEMLCQFGLMEIIRVNDQTKFLMKRSSFSRVLSMSLSINACIIVQFLQ